MAKAKAKAPKVIIAIAGQPPSVKTYVQLAQEILELQDELEALKAQYRAAVKSLPGYDPETTYQWGPLDFKARALKELNQMSALDAFCENPGEFFPTFLEFKLKKEHPRLEIKTNWSEPAVSIKE